MIDINEISKKMPVLDEILNDPVFKKHYLRSYDIDIFLNFYITGVHNPHNLECLKKGKFF